MGSEPENPKLQTLFKMDWSGVPTFAKTKSDWDSSNLQDQWRKFESDGNWSSMVHMIH